MSIFTYFNNVGEFTDTAGTGTLTLTGSAVTGRQTMPAAADGKTVSFTTATADWGTLRYVAGMDASTGGNVIWYAQLSADRIVLNGDTFQFDAGVLDITFA